MRTVTVLCLLVLSFVAAAGASAQVLDLLAPPHQWTGNADHPTSTMTVSQAPGQPLATTITSQAAEGEDYPKLRLEWKQPQDFSAYTRLRFRVRVTCSDKSVRTRRLALVFYDDSKRHEEMEGHPMWQQGIEHNVPVGRWVEYTDWITGLTRKSILQLDMYLYRETGEPLTQTWEFATMQLEGIGDTSQVLDTVVYARGALGGAAGRPAGSVGSSDGLRLQVGRQGGIASVAAGDAVIGRGDSGPSGLLLRDAATNDPPVMCGGTIRASGGGVRQTATVAKLGLELQAEYRSAGPYLEVAGKVRDLRGEDRAVTLYLAVPLTRGDWLWWDSVAKARTKAEEGELSYLERGMAYGITGLHSKYPLGAVTLPGKTGLTLGVRMDEPVVHRIGYNPGLRLLYLAVDLGLAPVQTVHGRSLSEAPFRFLIYRHDPAWGFRSALQRYYDFFPQFFDNRVGRPGGWFVWGDVAKMPGALEAGFGAHWGPEGPAAVRWDNEHGLLALLYIEAEFYQETMGDWNRRPTVTEALARLQKIAAGDPEELAKYRKLGYASSYVPANWVKEHSLDEALRVVSQATVTSVNYESDGQPTGWPGQYPWMAESKWGVIFPCNMDPDIPGGKGRFALDLYIEPGLKGMLEAGGRYGGIGLDSFGGYGQYQRANYRREHFKYSDTPLTFSALERVPVLAMPYSSVEWVRELARTVADRKLVLMANCSWGETPGWLTFAGPSLDIFGAEAPQFADPDFARAIARNKLCTDLPYQPVPHWQLQRNQLWAIFPGHGNEPEYMAQFAPTFRELAKAGWEPITQARVTPAAVRLERYGSGDTIYLVVHNPATTPVQASVAVDSSALRLGRFSAFDVNARQPLTVNGNSVPLRLDGQATVVVRLTRG